VVREIWWLGNVGVSWDWVHVLCADLDWVAEATVVMVGVSSSFNNQARFGTGQKNKKFGLILDGDSGNGIMGFCAGSWMDGYSMTRSGLLFLDRHGIQWRRLCTGWYPGLDSYGVWVWGFPFRIIPMIALLLKLRGYDA